MARLIDADKIPYKKETECLGHGMYMDTESVTKETIDKLPTVDAVPVVRCRDCRNWEVAIGSDGTFGYCELDQTVYGLSTAWYADDYCSYGERKDKCK